MAWEHHLRDCCLKGSHNSNTKPMKQVSFESCDQLVGGVHDNRKDGFPRVCCQLKKSGETHGIYPECCLLLGLVVERLVTTGGWVGYPITGRILSQGCASRPKSITSGVISWSIEGPMSNVHAMLWNDDVRKRCQIQ